MSSPKLFISYSWSNPSHEAWVLQLATELVESGVDAILDKWELKEGHDKNAFMEKMVTDPAVKKVVMVCDKIYAEKADGRNGGVGTETQIISNEVYDKIDQDKFVALICEKDDEGQPYIPTYYKSRMYIDFTEPGDYSVNFEKLVRWVYDKPLHKKPELGKKPAFLEGEPSISLGTSAMYKRLIESIKNTKPNAFGTLDEYLELFTENLERFRISYNGEEFDDEVIKSITDFLPYRNEIIEIVKLIYQYSPEERYTNILHKFFEGLIGYMSCPPTIQRHYETDFDNYKFIVHELFLCTIAIMIKNEAFEHVNILLTKPYYLPERTDYSNISSAGFGVFRNYVKSLDVRNKRLGLRKLSLRADLLKERARHTGIDFVDIMQAEFIIFLRSELHDSGYYRRWWPETLLYASYMRRAFEIFARSISKGYFQNVLTMLGLKADQSLHQLIKDFEAGKKKLPQWEWDSFSPKLLMNYEELCSTE